MKRIVFTIIILQFGILELAAQKFHGYVMFTNEKGELKDIVGANVFWLDSQIGVSTNESGFFTIERKDSTQQFIQISFVGMRSDTIQITSEKYYTIILEKVNELNTVIISESQTTTSLNSLNPINTVVMNKGELKKAACCNLSESFETSLTVDAEYSDAISGAKTIRLMGLDGVYAQIMIDNMPAVRGLASTYGLTYIPGTSIENIQVSKGAGSVVNGFESISGSINTTLKNGFDTDKESFLFNVFVNNGQRIELNINKENKLNENLSAAIFLHTAQLRNKLDHNNDLFLDAPLTENYIFSNHWKYFSGKVYETQFGATYIKSDLLGGQIYFNADQERDEQNGYGVNVQTNRFEAYMKNGFVFEKPNTSLGVITNFAQHNIRSFYGLRDYEGDETFLNVNGIFQTYILHTSHQIKTGMSFLYNKFDETFDSLNLQREERVPGIFAEYFFNQNENINLLVGNRIDFHNLYGVFYSPRIHLKYIHNEGTIFRGSVGKGFRVPNLFAENTSIFTSSRTLFITEEILPEQAWNYGISISQYFTILKKESTLVIDFYRTDFMNQLVVDLDTHSDQIIMSNLHGKSFTNSAQIELNYPAFSNFNIRAAYKYVDAKESLNNQLQSVSFVNKHRGLVNLSYETKNKFWLFDITSQYFGTVRIPNLEENHEAHDFNSISPDYFLFLGQITFKYKNFEFYSGSENISNYTQHLPIIGYENPFNEDFDASIVYAPTMSRKIYLGIRYTLKDKL